jgi:hypothetical protein
VKSGYRYENYGDNPHTWFIDDVSISSYEEPSISPDFQIFGLTDNKDLEFTIEWGSESTVKKIVHYWHDDEDEYHEIELVNGVDFTVLGDILTISKDFIISINPSLYEWYGFQISFGSDYTKWFGIAVVETTKPTIFPTQLSYDLSNKHDLFTTIKWGMAEEIESIYTADNDELTEGLHYEVVGGWLYIKNFFLTNNLINVNDEVDLTITFDTNDQATLNIKTVESGIHDATIDPNQISFYNHQFPDYIDINIAFNQAAKVEGDLYVIVNSRWTVEEMLYPYFEVFDNMNGTAVLRIDFTPVNNGKMLKSEEPYSIEYTYVTIAINFDVGSPAHFFMTIIDAEYRVTTSSNPEEGGWVNGGGTFNPDEQVTLEAFPNNGYIFWDWEDENEQFISADNPYSFNMPEQNLHIRAKFMAIQYFPVTFSVVGGNGSITAEANGEPFDSGDEIVIGSELDFTAHPASGYRVKSWTANDYTVPGYINETFKVGVHNSPFDLKVEFEPGSYYSITFHVTDAMGNVANASVIINSVWYNTNTEGIYVHSNLEAGDYNYTISKSGYQDVSGTVTITNSDVTEDVLLIALSVEPNTLSKVKVFPNPFTDVITISDPNLVKKIIVTNIIGQVLVSAELNGNPNVPTSHLDKGVYLIILEGKNGNKVVRRMIKE